MRRRPYIDPTELSLPAFGLPGAASRLRASDADRDRATASLRRHHADGRITTEEFEERTGRAYAATTLGDLDQLFADLPVLRTRGTARRPHRARMWHPRPIALPLVVALVAMAVVTSAHVLWLAWVLLFFWLFRFARRDWWWHSAR